MRVDAGVLQCGSFSSWRLSLWHPQKPNIGTAQIRLSPGLPSEWLRIVRMGILAALSKVCKLQLEE